MPFIRFKDLTYLSDCIDRDLLFQSWLYQIFVWWLCLPPESLSVESLFVQIYILTTLKTQFKPKYIPVLFKLTWDNYKTAKNIENFKVPSCTWKVVLVHRINSCLLVQCYLITQSAKFNQSFSIDKSWLRASKKTIQLLQCLFCVRRKLMVLNKANN